MLDTGLTKVQRPILRYHGGKWLLAPWIISHFPKHRVYVEAFGGGGSVLLRKERCYCEIYNDLWDTVVNVFKIMRDPATAMQLKQALELTPFSRTDFMLTGEENLKHIKDPIEKARLTILRSFAGFGSAATNAKYATGFRSNSSRSGTTPAHNWVNWPKKMEFLIERLKGVVIENENYKYVTEQHDSDLTLHYWDPPYVHRTRNMKRGNAAYEYEFTDQDHIDMCEYAKTVKGFLIISGYDNEIYNDILNGWQAVKKGTHADGAVDRTEILWLNPKTTDTLFTEKLK